MVGMPSGLFLPFFFGMYTLFRGLGLYPLRLREPMACAFAAFVVQVTPSTPAVLFPLLDVTRSTASILAARLVTRRCCKAFTLLYLFPFCAFAIRRCSLPTQCRACPSSSPVHAFGSAEDAHFASFEAPPFAETSSVLSPFKPSSMARLTTNNHAEVCTLSRRDNVSTPIRCITPRHSLSPLPTSAGSHLRLTDPCLDSCLSREAYRLTQFR